jgi:hypothetical protein
MQIVGCAKRIEKLHRDGKITKVQYRESKEVVWKAVRGYNSVMRRYDRYKRITRSDKRRLQALIAAVVVTLKDRQKSIDGRDIR